MYNTIHCTQHLNEVTINYTIQSSIIVLYLVSVCYLYRTVGPHVTVRYTMTDLM